MTHIRISSTLLDSYAFYKHIDNDADKLEATIKREFVASSNMNVGTDFHHLLENKNKLNEFLLEDYDDYIKGPNGYIFLKDSFENFTHDTDLNFPFEVKFEEKVGFDSSKALDIILVAKCDQIVGNKVVEHKTTKYFSYDRYAKSLQWRAYLYLTKADEVEYRVFTVKADRKIPEIITIIDRDDASFNTYENIESDVLTAVDEVIHFAKKRALLNFLIKETK